MIIRKFWLEKELEDGRLWNGFINIEAENKIDIPDVISGDFWSRRLNEEVSGQFRLDGERAKSNNFVISANTYSIIDGEIQEFGDWNYFEAKIEDCIVLRKTYDIEV